MTISYNIMQASYAPLLAVQYTVVGNRGEHKIWRNGSQLVLTEFKFGDLNAQHHIDLFFIALMSYCCHS